ncbi:MAG: proton-conducting transporter membrane subunit, partial [Bacteroidales bacterium]
IRKMGGIWKHVKVTWVLMWIGSLALAGIPFFAGYYSKDMILEAAFASHSVAGQLAYWMGIGAAFLTAFYSWRLLIMTFHGKPRADEHVMAHVHESPAVMILPLFVLAAGAVFSGWLGYDMFVGHASHEFWREAIKDLHQTIEHAHHVESWVALAPTVVGVAGIFLAYVLYLFVPSVPPMLANSFNGLYRFLLNKWYFDELYDFLFVRPAFRIGKGLWQGGDGALIDGVGPDGVAAATTVIAKKVGKLQSGYLYHYAYAMLIGVAVFVTWYMFNAR